jgi:nitrite reductase/ring-hydroxylating ferredoxin subunit
VSPPRERVVSGRDADACLRCPSRRAILKLGATGAALAVLPAACGAPAVPSGPIPAGNLATTPVGTLLVLSVDGVVLGRDAGGLYALSAICTHAGCIVVVESQSGAADLFCPCHGSKFSSDGAVTMGPARDPLPHFEVDLAPDGSITIQPAIPVDAAARTATP